MGDAFFERKEEKTEANTGEITSSELAYSSSRFSDEIDVHVSKLRRWSLELEKQGYNIMRDEFDKRVYLETDKEVFLKLKDYIEEKKMKAEDAYKAVAAMFANVDYKHRLPVKKEAEQKTIQLTHAELQEMLNQAAELATSKLLSDMEKHNTTLVNSFNESLKIQQQTQLLLEQKEEEKPKKSFFGRLFS